MMIVFVYLRVIFLGPIIYFVYLDEIQQQNVVLLFFRPHSPYLILFSFSKN